MRASGMATFFMDETKSQYPKPDPEDSFDLSNKISLI